MGPKMTVLGENQGPNLRCWFWDPQKALSWAEPRRLTYFASKSVRVRCTRAILFWAYGYAGPSKFGRFGQLFWRIILPYSILSTQCRYLFLVCCALTQPTSMPNFDDLIQQRLLRGRQRRTLRQPGKHWSFLSLSLGLSIISANPVWKSQKNRDISAAVWPFFTKFGTVMHICPHSLIWS